MISEYKRAYNATQRELKNLLQKRSEIETRLLLVRQNLNRLAALCENEGIKITPSPEATQFLKENSLTDDVLNVLASEHPEWIRPAAIKAHLVELGRDMNSYRNPVATIHMILKRYKEANKIRERTHPKGFKVYQIRSRDVSWR